MLGFRLITMLFGLYFVTSNSFAQVQEFGSLGFIDWGELTVTAVGIGAPDPKMPPTAARPMAIQAARKVAMRNALEILKGIQLSSETTVEDLMLSSDVIRTSVQGYLRKFKESDPKYMSDKTIEITVTIPIDAELLEGLLPKTIAEAPAALSPGDKTGEYTGLIIDARGLGFIPSLSPKIFDTKNKELFGHAHIKRSSATEWGVAAYAETPEEATENKMRLGANPLRVKASGVKNAKGDLILDEEEAKVFSDATRGTPLLSQCRIVIIMD